MDAINNLVLCSDPSLAWELCWVCSISFWTRQQWHHYDVHNFIESTMTSLWCSTILVTWHNQVQTIADLVSLWEGGVWRCEVILHQSSKHDTNRQLSVFSELTNTEYSKSLTEYITLSISLPHPSSPSLHPHSTSLILPFLPSFSSLPHPPSPPSSPFSFLSLPPPSLLQYTHTAPRDDWVVVDHGLIAPSKSSDVDHQPESGSWENEEEGDTPTLEMEVSQLSRKKFF